MVVCPNCNHQNPEGSLQCENCYTPLPATISCPNCGASVQTDATFCGQCGFNLQAETLSTSSNIESILESSEAPPEKPEIETELPEVAPTGAMSSPIVSPWDEEEPAEEETAFSASSSAENNLGMGESQIGSDSTEVMKSSVKPEDFDIYFHPEAPPEPIPEAEPMPWETSKSEPMPWETSEPAVSSEASEPVVENRESEPEPVEEEEESMSFGEDESTISGTEPIVPPPPPPASFAASKPFSTATQLQTQKASLFHVQTNTKLEIPDNLDVIHIGKPNSQIPPDIDVAGFPDSEVVSRIHADIRVEGDAYFIEDVGSSNGTYINHTPLLKGNRHRLRAGDRIALGKGDLVTFIFQIN